MAIRFNGQTEILSKEIEELPTFSQNESTLKLEDRHKPNSPLIPQFYGVFHLILNHEALIFKRINAPSLSA